MTATTGLEAAVSKALTAKEQSLGNSGARRADDMPSESRTHSTETNRSPWVKDWGRQGFGEEAYGASWVAQL